MCEERLTLQPIGIGKVSASGASRLPIRIGWMKTGDHDTRDHNMTPQMLCGTLVKRTDNLAFP